MTFLNPLVLFGLLAVAIPLIIHLFNFRRPKRVDFSSLTFLKELQKSTMRRVRIKQWLLLALRTLIILCLVMAFARPTLVGPMAGPLGQRARTSIVLVIDTSPSMNLRDAQGRYLEQARALAADIAGQMEQGDELYLLPTTERRATAAEPFNSRTLALEAIQDLETKWGTLPLDAPLAEGVRLLDRALNINKELYLISDLQQGTFPTALRLDAPADIRFFMVPVGQGNPANVAITDVTVQSRIVEAGQPVRLQATLTNYGTEPLNGYVASVFLEGERVAQSTADLAPGVPQTMPFTVTPRQRGWLSGVVESEEDAFGQDNLRHFTLHVPERRQVLVVRGDGQRTDHLELALSPALTQGRVPFALTTIPETSLPASNLAGFDAVVLVGVQSLSSGETANLAGYVQQGGGVFLFPGAQATGPDDTALLSQLGGGQFVGFSGAPGTDQTVAQFEAIDLEHPLFEGVFERTGPDRRVESPALYHTANYRPGTGDEQTLIGLSNGYPMLQEIRRGTGRMLVSAVGLDPTWSDLPTRGLFIPLMYRALFYLSAGQEGQGAALYAGAGGTLSIGGAPGPVRLVAPDGADVTPEQRTVLGAVLLQVPTDLVEPGLYEIRAGDTLLRRFALTAPPLESDLKRLSVADAQRQFSQSTGQTVTVVQATQAGQSLAQVIDQQRHGVELWNVFLWLAFLFLVTEMLVAMQWRPEPVPA